MAARIQRKPKGSYHHPDLERALVDAALRTIREEGVEALTLRSVGARLGVSRTALYRHFEDKTALLARVALEGFRLFREALQSAAARARQARRDPLEEMGVAYVNFAMANESHYRTMFGGAADSWDRFPDLSAEAEAAFEVLAGVIVEEQRMAHIIEGDPERLAQIVWSGVHGIAMLAMAGHLRPLSDDAGEMEAFIRLNARVLRDGLKVR